MGWKDLFIAPNENEASEPTPTSKTAAPTITPYTPPNGWGQGSSGQNQSASNNVNNAFETQLRQAITSGNGSEYAKFKAACEGLRAVLPDETVRLKSAFVSMTAMGVNKESLVRGAKISIGHLNDEKASFETAMNETYASQVDGGAGRLTDIDRQIEDKMKAINNLQTEVAQLNSEKGQISNQVNQSRNKIETARRDFALAFEKLVNEVNSDMAKINKDL